MASVNEKAVSISNKNPDFEGKEAWYSLLQMNKPHSTWREESLEARELLTRSGFIVVAVEISGIEGPVCKVQGMTYVGLSQIKKLARMGAKQIRDAKYQK